jgi:hypothetical protein
MVVSISPQQTVLWDSSGEFTGEPSEFAWVLPVRDGSRLELARAEWIQALDLATQPAIKGPDLSCGGGGSIGCGSSDNSAAAEGVYSADGGYQSGAGVEVVSQSVVGPYESVIVRSSKGEAIYLWLRLNHFAVPDAIEPILSQYTGEGFDFLAVRLRPNQGVRAMQPIRVVMPGAGSSLPLRMVAAGIGARVGLTLFVVSEARYHSKNFPDAKLDRSKLAWDNATSRSNYRDLMEEALAKTGGRGWATEYAGNLSIVTFNGADSCGPKARAPISLSSTSPRAGTCLRRPSRATAGSSPKVRRRRRSTRARRPTAATLEMPRKRRRRARGSRTRVSYSTTPTSRSRGCTETTCGSRACARSFQRVTAHRAIWSSSLRSRTWRCRRQCRRTNSPIQRRPLLRERRLRDIAATAYTGDPAPYWSLRCLLVGAQLAAPSPLEPERGRRHGRQVRAGRGRCARRR